MLRTIRYLTCSHTYIYTRARTHTYIHACAHAHTHVHEHTLSGRGEKSFRRTKIPFSSDSTFIRSEASRRSSHKGAKTQPDGLGFSLVIPENLPRSNRAYKSTRKIHTYVLLTTKRCRREYSSTHVIHIQKETPLIEKFSISDLKILRIGINHTFL